MILAGKTDIGQIRSHNEDSFCYQKINDTIAYAIVCDGMGGVNGGQIASSTVCNTISEIFDQYFETETPPYHIKDILKRSIRMANAAVLKKSKDYPDLVGMGTTLVIAIVVGTDIFVANVGDSRAYLCFDTSIQQISIDHSAVQELVDQGKITKEEARVHPKKNIITRAVGVGDFVDFDFFTYHFLPGDRVLLCSDGLSNYFTEDELSEYLNRKVSPQLIINDLISDANQRGGHDNITAVVIKQQ